MSSFQRPQLVRNLVYEFLHKEILSGVLEPGIWLKEQDIAQRLQVSRTPIREAMQRLTQDGLLEAFPNYGVRVRTLSLKEALDAYSVREMLEGMAARLCAECRDTQVIERIRGALTVMEDVARGPDHWAQITADTAFHSAIAEGSDNGILLEAIRGLGGRVTQIKIVTRDQNSTQLTFVQHRAIFDAIVASQPDEAEAAMRQHIQTFRKVIEDRTPDTPSQEDPPLQMELGRS